MFEDHDMKIAGAVPSKDIKSANNPLNISEEYNRERENGNVLKAKELGRKIAAMLSNSENMFPHDEEDVNAELKLQKETLLAFSAVAGLEQVCPSQATSYAAQNSFYSAAAGSLNGALGKPLLCSARMMGILCIKNWARPFIAGSPPL